VVEEVLLDEEEEVGLLDEDDEGVEGFDEEVGGVTEVVGTDGGVPPV